MRRSHTWSWLLLSSRGRRYGGGRCQRRGGRRAGDAASWHVLKSFRKIVRDTFSSRHSKMYVYQPGFLSWFRCLFSLFFLKNIEWNSIRHTMSRHVSQQFCMQMMANNKQPGPSIADCHVCHCVILGVYHYKPNSWKLKPFWDTWRQQFTLCSILSEAQRWCQDWACMPKSVGRYL